MKLILDENICKKHGLTVEETLYLLHIRLSENHTMTEASLIDREALVYKGETDEFFVTQHWNDELDAILCESTGSKDISDERLAALAQKMRDCFPSGRMRPGSPYYYRCNNKEVINKLRKFFTIYGNYSDEEILDATKRYVASFCGNYTNMRLIKYFILKDDIKTGHVEQISELATMLENKDNVSYNDNDDWLMISKN